MAGITALALVMTIGATSASAAKAATCSITITDTNRTYPRLQQAVDAAKPGAHLIVKGTCHGGTVIDKRVVIVGVGMRRAGKPELDGDGRARVLTISPKVTVSITSLTIGDGRATRFPYGGGIHNTGRLTLRDVIVRGSRADWGGGIHNKGVLRMVGQSVLYNNKGQDGCGLHNAGRAVLAGTATIRSNGPGTAVFNRGTLLMKDTSAIVDNDGWRFGGGLLNYATGSLTMRGASSIHDNSNRGGIVNHGTVTMLDTSSIHHNTAGGTDYPERCSPGTGGGVLNYGTLTMGDASSIHDNLSRMCARSVTVPIAQAGLGGGVYSLGGTFTMSGSSTVSGNQAESITGGETGRGGGVYNAGSPPVGVNCAPQTYANVYGNTPDDCYLSR